MSSTQSSCPSRLEDVSTKQLASAGQNGGRNLYSYATPNRNHQSTSTGISVSADPPLLPRVANGDQNAIAECIGRYKNLVWSLARRSCPDVQAAEDAVQDIFLKLWRIADRFNPELASETTFVAMIARRSLIDLSRKRSWNMSSVEFDSLASTQSQVGRQAELKDEAARAEALLDELPDPQKQVIRLSIYDGLSHARIAESTGMSLGTVKSHIRRGLIKLRNSLFANEEALALDTPFAKGEIR